MITCAVSVAMTGSLMVILGFGEVKMMKFCPANSPLRQRMRSFIAMNITFVGAGGGRSAQAGLLSLRDERKVFRPAAGCLEDVQRRLDAQLEGQAERGQVRLGQVEARRQDGVLECERLANSFLVFPILLSSNVGFGFALTRKFG